jgi:hypothetical protein
MKSFLFLFFTYSDAKSKNSSSSIRKVENTQFLHRLIDQSVHSKSQLLLPIFLTVAPNICRVAKLAVAFFIYFLLPEIDSMVDKGKRQILTSCCHTGTRWARNHFRFLATKLKYLYGHIVQFIILF